MLPVPVRIAAAILACACGPVLAQSPQRLDNLVVAASRTAQPIADLLADVTVIGRDEIGRSGAQSFAEVLQRQPGVEVTMNGGPGATSSLYGADAIGGVIQSFTKHAQGEAWGGSMSSVGFDAIAASGNFSYNPDRDGYSAQNVGGNAVLPWALGQEIVVQHFRHRLDNQFDAGAPYFDDRTTTLEAWFQCDADFDCAPQNVDRVTLKGVTLGLDVGCRETTATGSLDLQSPQDYSTGGAQFFAGVQWQS